MNKILNLKIEDFNFPKSSDLGKILVQEEYNNRYDEIFLELNDGQIIVLRDRLLIEDEELIAKALELREERDTLTASFLQRRLKIGYNQAENLRLNLVARGLTSDVVK